ncbi:hypothetical protein [Winogradskyella algicola]|nr:hypothetical protein [Winogradskyella algicola]
MSFKYMPQIKISSPASVGLFYASNTQNPKPNTQHPTPKANL